MELDGVVEIELDDLGRITGLRSRLGELDRRAVRRALRGVRPGVPVAGQGRLVGQALLGHQPLERVSQRS